MADLQALDLRRRSASTVAPPPSGKPAAVEVAKLIDVSQVHRLQGLPGRLPGVERPRPGDRLSPTAPTTTRPT